MPVADLGQSDRTAHRSHVDMSVFHVADINHRIRAFQSQVALQVFGRNRAGGRTNIDGGVGRNKQLIVDLARFQA